KVVTANSADLATVDRGAVSARPACTTSGSSTPPPTGVSLQGGAGDAIVTQTSTDVETEAVEGDNNVKINGFKVEADGSDIQVKSIKVTFQNQDGGSSSRLDHYVDTVTVWEGSTKVGSADVSDFSKDGTEYSKGITLNNAIVRDRNSNKQTFYV